VSITQRLGAVVVALFAIAFARAPTLIRLFNPVMRRLLVTRLPAGPNVLLKVRGRKSGLPRSFPVAFLDLGERGYLQAASGDVDWVRNLRAAGEAVIVSGGRAATFEASELDPETAGRLLLDLLAPFPRSRLVRAVVGPIDRPPVGVLRYFRLRVDHTIDEYTAVARRQPLFELRRLGTPTTSRAAGSRPDDRTNSEGALR
jgi:deazaflavin-dependent oxidoreductase (nitroreductase family)